MVDPEHVKVTLLLTDDERGRLFVAISNYAQSQVVPQGCSPAFMACFELMRSVIDKQFDRYREKCERNRANIKKRWEIEHQPQFERANNDSTEYDGTDICTTEYGRIPSYLADTNRKERKRKEMKGEEDEKSATAPAAFLDSDELTANIADHQHADELIRKFGLPDCDASRDALLEDAERCGWDAVETALKSAAASNSRQRISVNFYRAVLNGGRGGSGGREEQLERF